MTKADIYQTYKKYIKTQFLIVWKDSNIQNKKI